MPLLTPENFQRTCRICLSDGDLYDTRTSMYEDHTIADIFRSLINVKELNITESFAHIVYPQFICLDCIKNILFTKLFFDQCYKAHKQLSKAYAYLTLYQHQSVVIPKPLYLYRALNTIMTKCCKLNKKSPKQTAKLQKAALRKNQEDKTENLGESLVSSINDKPKPVKRISKLTSGSQSGQSTKKQKIGLLEQSTRKRNNNLTSIKPKYVNKMGSQIKNNTDSKLSPHIDLRRKLKRTSKENIPKVVTDSSSKHIVKQGVHKVKKNPRKKRMSSRKRPSTDYIDENIKRTARFKSKTASYYREHVERMKRGVDPEPSNIFSKNNRLLKKLHAMHLNNLKKRTVTEASLKTDDVNVNNSEVGDVKNKNDSKSVDDAFDVKPESIEGKNTDIEKTVGEHKVHIYDRVDTVELYTALADINRDKYNIDLDHCYTNLSVYKNVRYILPRLNYQRTNDLLYPAPDIARKTDQVLAGNINKRLASILSGNPVEHKVDQSSSSKEFHVKIEPIDLEDTAMADILKIIENQDIGEYIKPEFVNMNFIDIIKKEPIQDEFMET